MSEENNFGKTLYPTTEAVLNDIIISINDLDKRLEALTIAFNKHVIFSEARFVALTQMLKFSSDDTLDFYNLTKKEETRIQEKIASNLSYSIG